MCSEGKPRSLIYKTDTKRTYAKPIAGKYKSVRKNAQAVHPLEDRQNLKNVRTASLFTNLQEDSA